MTLKSIPKPALASLAAVASIGVLGTYVWMQEYRPPVLEVFLFALKGGQAALVRTPDDQRILIDGGSNAEVVRKISSVLPFYSRRIDAVVATEPDGDNISGLIDVLERYEVGRIYVPATTLESLGISTSTDPAYREFLESAARKGLAPIALGRGDSMALGGKSDARAEVLFPADPLLFEYSRASAPRLLFNISYKDHAVLLMGDASTKIQKHVAPSIGKADVVVFSHSASPAGVSRDLISAARPEYLVYSKAVSKSALKKPRTTPKKGLLDPVAGILTENRFNLKEVGVVKIVIDGRSIQIGL